MIGVLGGVHSNCDCDFRHPCSEFDCGEFDGSDNLWGSSRFFMVGMGMK